MMEPYEQRLLLSWLSNFSVRVDRYRWAQDGFTRFVLDEAEHLDIDLGDENRTITNDIIVEALRVAASARESATPSVLELNLRAVGQLLQLSEQEHVLMGALVRAKVAPQFEDLFEMLELDEIRAGDSTVMGVLATLLGLTRGELLDAMSPRGRLLGSGLFTIDYRSDCQPLPALTRFLQAQAEPLADVRAARQRLKIDDDLTRFG